MTVSKKLIELEILLKKSQELSSKLSELNYDVDENEITNSTIDSKKTLKNDINIIKKIMKEFKETHEKISEILICQLVDCKLPYLKNTLLREKINDLG